MRTKCLVKAFLIVVLAHFIAVPGTLFSQSDFFKGKTIIIVQGRDPGGTGDMRVRAMTPFLQKYIPGNPNVVSEYMPGGGAARPQITSTAPPALTA